HDALTVALDVADRGAPEVVHGLTLPAGARGCGTGWREHRRTLYVSPVCKHVIDMLPEKENHMRHPHTHRMAGPDDTSGGGGPRGRGRRGGGRFGGPVLAGPRGGGGMRGGPRFREHDVPPADGAAAWFAGRLPEGW